VFRPALAGTDGFQKLDREELTGTEQSFSLLNVRSANGSREHLIEVATAVFAREGFSGASLRTIAAEAGVSAALLVHHFGSKQQLIKEAITTNLGAWMADKDHLVELGLSEALAQWPQTAAEGEAKLQFFKQVMLAGGETADHLFERMVFEAKLRLEQFQASGQMRKIQDIDTAAVMLAAYGLAPLLISGSLKAHFGVEFTDPEVSGKLAASSLELFALFQPGEPAAAGKTKTGDKSKSKNKKAGDK
jgi:AcrR family transcriptional regulator